MRTTEDRLVDQLEAVQTREFARLQRRELGWEGHDRVDPLSLVSVNEIWTVSGRAPFQLRFASDRAYGAGRGRTRYVGSTLTVLIPESNRHKALFGDGLARFFIAEAFGEATLRHLETRRALLAKHRQGSRESQRLLVSAFASMDFQAGVFAASFLIGDDVAPGSASPEELSVRYGIDAFSARVFFAELQSASP
jgi:hypothetical protein